jgi:hypothetical protein
VTNSSRIKGTIWATACCAYLQPDWPHVERRVQYGNKDRGDISGVIGVVWECKNEAKYDPGGWLREAEVERANDNADIAVVFAKRKGKAAPKDGYILMTPATLVRLLQAAGYGNTPPPPTEGSDA